MTSADQGILQVLRILSFRWPNKFAAINAQDLLPMWRRACRGIPDDILEEVAQEVRATHHGYPPDPPTFVRQAKKLLAARHPEVVIPEPSERPWPSGVPKAKDVDRVSLLSRRAFDRIGSWSSVNDVWTRLTRDARGEDLQLVRLGKVSDATFDAAIDAELAAIKSRRAELLPDSLA